MKGGYRLLWLIPMLVGLYVIGRLGSVEFAIGLAGFIAVIALFMYSTRIRPGRTYDRQPPSRADADLQTWDTSP